MCTRSRGNTRGTAHCARAAVPSHTPAITPARSSMQHVQTSRCRPREGLEVLRLEVLRLEERRSSCASVPLRLTTALHSVYHTGPGLSPAPCRRTGVLLSQGRPAQGATSQRETPQGPHQPRHALPAAHHPPSPHRRGRCCSCAGRLGGCHGRRCTTPGVRALTCQALPRATVDLRVADAPTAAGQYGSSRNPDFSMRVLSSELKVTCS